MKQMDTNQINYSHSQKELMNKKNELNFALIWIAAYVIVMNIALQFCNGLDNLETKTPQQLLIPVICITILAILSTAFIIKNHLQEKYGLTKPNINIKTYLYFIPLILMSCTNLKNGLAIQAPLPQTILMILNISIAGYVEEIIFRGFLFRSMEKENLNQAIIISAITFGAGHIVNLANTKDTFGVFLQICYAIAIGFLYTIIVYKSKSLYPCINSHMFVNGTSVLALDHGLFTQLLNNPSPQIVQAISALLIILISGSYALWLWKKA